MKSRVRLEGGDKARAPLDVPLFSSTNLDVTAENPRMISSVEKLLPVIFSPCGGRMCS